MEQAMRYVLLAFAGIALGAIWLNTSDNGQQLQRKLMAHPEEPGRLY